MKQRNLSGFALARRLKIKGFFTETVEGGPQGWVNRRATKVAEDGSFRAKPTAAWFFRSFYLRRRLLPNLEQGAAMRRQSDADLSGLPDGRIVQGIFGGVLPAVEAENLPCGAHCGRA